MQTKQQQICKNTEIKCINFIYQVFLNCFLQYVTIHSKSYILLILFPIIVSQD